ncbi:MAG: zinc-ribbon domain containing protein [Candidatus Thermoplasmatota archaeon]
MMKKINKNKILTLAANEFTEKVCKLPTVLEVAIHGSVAGNDSYPDDLDLAVIVHNLDDIATIAKYARQISSHYHGWEVFLFDEKLMLLGRVCHRRECPGQSADCYALGCGQPPHLKVDPEFEYDERTFFTSPIQLLWTSFKTSRLLARKDKLGIVESRKYPVLKDIKIECIICGKTFVFTGEQQKWYQKRGLSRPKRCPSCIEKQRMAWLRNW